MGKAESTIKNTDALWSEGETLQKSLLKSQHCTKIQENTYARRSERVAAMD
jgi:hypothetical protein